MKVFRITTEVEVIKEERLVQNAEKVGEYLLKELISLQREYPDRISNVRGRGLFCAIDLPSYEYCEKLKKKLFDNGVLVLTCGERSLRFRPSLIVTKEEIKQGIDAIRRSIKEI